jgi:DNA-binding NarL/FixJ family response regulator
VRTPEERPKRRPTRVLLADGHAMFAQALAGLLGADGRGLEVAGIADGEGAARAAERERPDVVVTEVDGSPVAAGEAVRRLLAVRPRPAVVVLTRHADPSVERAALGAGAGALVSKDDRLADLLSAVEAAADGAEGG